MKSQMKVFLDREQNVKALVSGQSIIRIIFNNPVKHLVVPSECDGLTIKEIGDGIDSVFGLDHFHKMEFESITIDNKISKINTSAFCDISVRDFFWPAGCGIVPTDCFYSSTILNFHGSENIKGVNKHGFCSAFVSSLDLCNLEIIGERAFFGTTVNSFKTGSSVRSIGKAAFQRLNGIAEFKWFENVNSIPEECFKYSNIKRITGMDNVTSIKPSAFACTVFEEIEWPRNCTEIPDKCFTGNRSLKKVTGIENVQIIASKAFSYCTALSEFDFPESLEKIGSYAFSHTNLSVINLEETSVECVDDYTFSYIESLRIFHPPCTAIVKNKAFYASNVFSSKNLIGSVTTDG